MTADTDAPLEGCSALESNYGPLSHTKIATYAVAIFVMIVGMSYVKPLLIQKPVQPLAPAVSGWYNGCYVTVGKGMKSFNCGSEAQPEYEAKHKAAIKDFEERNPGHFVNQKNLQILR